MLSAAVTAVAAIGDVPLAGCLLAGGGPRFFWGCAWACERAAWPLVGMMLGMLAAGGVTQSVGVMPAAAVGALLAAGTMTVCRLSGAKAADAASLTLLMAAATAAAGGELAPRLGGSGMAAVVVWLLIGGMGWAWSRSQRAAMETLLPESHRSGHFASADGLQVDVLPAKSSLRQTLMRLAMVAALAAMAGWLMLEPASGPATGSGHEPVSQDGQWDRTVQLHHAAAAWALFTAAWFIGLAVPQATLQDGVAGAMQWERLFRTAARVGNARAAGRFGVGSLRPGPVRFAGGVALTQAAILGWPVLVCAVLALPMPTAARLPLGIVIGLATAAAVVWAAVWLGAAAHASRETTFAVTLGIALAMVGVLLTVVADSAFPHRQSTLRGPPSLPSLAPPSLQRLDGG